MFFFLVEKMRVNKILMLGRNFYKRIEIVKKRLKAKNLLKRDRFDLLCTYWDRIVQEMNHEAQKRDDQKLKVFIVSLITIKSDVKYACLKEYLRRTELKYFMAFTQWRYKFTMQAILDTNQLEYSEGGA